MCVCVYVAGSVPGLFTLCAHFTHIPRRPPPPPTAQHITTTKSSTRFIHKMRLARSINVCGVCVVVAHTWRYARACECVEWMYQLVRVVCFFFYSWLSVCVWCMEKWCSHANWMAKLYKMQRNARARKQNKITVELCVGVCVYYLIVWRVLKTKMHTIRYWRAEQKKKQKSRTMICIFSTPHNELWAISSVRLSSGRMGLIALAAMVVLL